MAVYYVTILALSGFGYVYTEKNKGKNAVALYLAAAFLILVFITSFRYAIGFDYFSYRGMYENTAAWPLGSLLQSYLYEPIFHLACKAASWAGLSYHGFLICVDSFLVCSVMWFIWRYSKIPWMSVYFYITLQFLAYNMNLIRQSMAVCFFMFAFPFLEKRKFAPFCILLFIGGLIHNSLWFTIPLYVLLPRKFPRKFYIFLTVSAVCVYLFFEPVFHIVQPLLPQKYAAYEGSYFWYASGYEYILPSAVYLVLIFLYRSKITDTVRRAVYLNSALYNFLISLFIMKHFILERFAVYPFVFSLIAIPDIIVSCQEEAAAYGPKKQRAHVAARILFLLFGAAYLLFAAAKGFHNVYPYVSLTDKAAA